MSRDESILSYGLFDGDRDSDVTEFSNKMVVTRKQHDCVICRESIPVAARVRAQTERDNQDKCVMTFYVCELCCNAIADRHVDDFAAIHIRTAIGMAPLDAA